jgi:DNA-binding beta-propeller fold protein YncE
MLSFDNRFGTFLLVVFVLLLAALYASSAAGKQDSGEQPVGSDDLDPGSGVIAITKVATPADGTDFYFESNVLGILQYAAQWGEKPPSDEEGNFNGQVSVAYNPDIGLVFVADEFNNRIQFFEPDGTFLGTFGEPGSDPGQFDGPTGVDSRGEMVFVADRNNHRIQILNPDGGVVDVIGEGPGDDPGMFDNPFGVTVDRLTGEIYVADTYNHRIQKFDPEGNFMGMWGSKGSGTEQFDNPTSIALGADGLVYVADSNNNRIQVLQVNGEDGEFIDSIGKKGTADGRFNLPYGVAVDEDGNLFVADLDNNRI